MSQSSDQGPFKKLGGEKDQILDVRQEVERHSSALGKISEWVGWLLARPLVFFVLLVLHLGWIVLNMRIIPGLEPWDPYPFTFLATLASVEAPFFSLLILLSQRRESRIQELRNEVSIQVSLHSEREISAALKLIDAVRAHHRIASPLDEKQLSELKEALDPEHLTEKIRRRLDREHSEAS